MTEEYVELCLRLEHSYDSDIVLEINNKLFELINNYYDASRILNIYDLCNRSRKQIIVLLKTKFESCKDIQILDDFPSYLIRHIITRRYIWSLTRRQWISRDNTKQIYAKIYSKYSGDKVKMFKGFVTHRLYYWVEAALYFDSALHCHVNIEFIKYLYSSIARFLNLS